MARRIFLALGVLALIGWGWGYFWLHGLACSWRLYDMSSGCPYRLPWTAGREDLVILFLLPGAIVALLFGLAWGLGRPKQPDRSDRPDRPDRQG